MFDRAAKGGCKDLMELFDLWDSVVETDFGLRAEMQSPKLKLITAQSSKQKDNQDTSLLAQNQEDSYGRVFDYSPTPISEDIAFTIQTTSHLSPEKPSAVSQFLHGIRRLVRGNSL